MRAEEIFAEAVTIVKGFGFRCIATKYRHQRENDLCTYCYITDGTNIGYMQVDDFKIGVQFSTVHKPKNNCGTGFAILNPNPISRLCESVFTLEEITKELVESTFNKPRWANEYRSEKYKSWNDYAANSLTAKLKAEFIEL